MSKDRSRTETSLEGLKGCVGISSPPKLDVLLQQAGQGDGDMGVVLDKSPIKVCKAKEHLNIMLGLGDWPRSDTVDLFGVHVNASLGNNVSKEFHLGGMELALLQLGKKSMLE